MEESCIYAPEPTPPAVVYTRNPQSPYSPSRGGFGHGRGCGGCRGRGQYPPMQIHSSQFSQRQQPSWPPTSGTPHPFPLLHNQTSQSLPPHGSPVSSLLGPPPPSSLWPAHAYTVDVLRPLYHHLVG